MLVKLLVLSAASMRHVETSVAPFQLTNASSAVTFSANDGKVRGWPTKVSLVMR